jgi:hypothetical protein
MAMPPESSSPVPQPSTWDLRLFHWLPPAIVLVTVVWVLLTLREPVFANHPAYLVTLLVCGTVSLVLIIRWRPRRIS